MNDRILNIKELSSYLNISVSEIRKLVRAKRIPYFRVGNRIKFKIQSINSWLNKLEEEEQKFSLFL